MFPCGFFKCLCCYLSLLPPSTPNIDFSPVFNYLPLSTPFPHFTPMFLASFLASLLQIYIDLYSNLNIQK